MLLRHWLYGLFSARGRTTARRQWRSLRLRSPRRRRAASRALRTTEALEDRTLLAVLTVNALDDNTTSNEFLTLREAILLVNNGGDSTDALGRPLTAGEQAQINGNFGDNDTIAFHSGLFANGPQTIQLALPDDANPDTTGRLEITADVFILGPGRDWLTINAQSNSQVFYVDGISEEVIDVRIAGLGLTNGIANGSEGELVAGWHNGLSGGTIYNDSANLSLLNLIISGSMAGENGGAIFNNGGVVSLSNSRLTVNHANLHGGAIFNDGEMAITTSTFYNNRANFNNDGTGSGAAIYNAGELSVTASTLHENRQAVAGGGIYNDGDLSLVNSTISMNWADEHGGGIFNNDTFTALNSTIQANRADITNDAAGTGGGIWTADGEQTRLDNTIVAGNYVGPTPGTVHNDIGGADVTAASSFNLIGNAASAGGLEDLSDDPDSGNIVGIDGAGTRAITSILNLNLSSNGGPTQTHALVGNSAAINAGSNDLADGLDWDQRGAPFLRIFGGTIDIGAYERVAGAAIPQQLVVSTNSDVVDGIFSPGNLSLRESVMLANAFPERVQFGTIRFADALNQPFGFGTFNVIEFEQQHGRMEITRDLNIVGPGADRVVVDALHQEVVFDDGNPVLQVSQSQIFYVDGFTDGVIDVEIVGLTLANGHANGNEGETIWNWDNGLNGGAVFNEMANLTLRDLEIVDSTAGVEGNGDGNGNGDEEENVGNGGGVFNNHGTLTVVGSTLARNRAEGSGGGIFNTHVLVETDDETFFNRQGLTTMTNSTLSGNAAVGHGGGIVNHDGMLVLINSTLTLNRADAVPNPDEGPFFGGGIWTSGTALRETHLYNTLVAGNFRGTGNLMRDIEGRNVDPASANNLVGNGMSSGGLVDGTNGNRVGVVGTVGDLGTIFVLDPNTARPLLENNGGTTSTHALAVHPLDSVLVNPARDNGNNDFATFPGGAGLPGAGADPLVRDQRGAPFSRFFFPPDGFESGTVDIGAFEVQPLRLVVDNTGDTVDGDYSEGELTLREAILLANGNPGLHAVDIPDRVMFHDDLFVEGPNSITLSLGRITIANYLLDIVGSTGDTGNLMTISGGDSSQIFYVDGLAREFFDVRIFDLSFIDGNANESEGWLIGGLHNGTRGGAIVNQSAGLTIHSSMFTGNRADRGGAAVFSHGIEAVTSIVASTMVGNVAVEDGGAIFNKNGLLFLTDSLISGNDAGFGGGGVFNHEGDVFLLNSTIAGNRAASYGGGLASIRGSAWIIGSTVSGNAAFDHHGGGLYNLDSNMRVHNSTISGNGAIQDGGGIFNDGTLNVVNSTIVNNLADSNSNGFGSGGGIFTWNRAGNSVTLQNSIVAANLRRTGANATPSELGGRNATPTSSANNLIGDAGSAGGLTHGTIGNIVGNEGVGLIDVATVLDTVLADNGGPTLTHALVANSPALNAGENAWATNAGLTTDQRGQNRFFDATVDIGAYERTINLPPTVELVNVLVTVLPEDHDTTERTKIADIVIHDDGIGTNDLSLSGADAALFEIDEMQLFLIAGAVLDSETNPLLEVSVRVNDATLSPNPNDRVDVEITILPRDVSPGAFDRTFWMPRSTENGIVIGTLFAEPAEPGNTLSYSLTGGTGQNLFAIDGATGRISVVDSGGLNFDLNPIYTLTVEITDVETSSTSTSAVSIAPRDQNDILLFDSVTGIWHRGIEEGAGGEFSQSLGPRWSTAVNWDFYRGDFTGNGLTDVAGRQRETGQWWVLRSTGDGFAQSPWVTWGSDSSAGWTDFFVADFTGDGRDDIVGRDGAGQFWLARSTGTRFDTVYAGRWVADGNWHSMVVGDFNGDGKAGIAGLRNDGHWFLSHRHGDGFGGRFFQEHAGRWTPSSVAGWQNVMAADFSGNGRTDVIARTSVGEWWIGESIVNVLGQNRFLAYFGGTLTTEDGFDEIFIGDFDGNGMADLASRNSAGTWFVLSSNGSGTAMTEGQWGQWPQSGDWMTVVGDVDGDGRSDLIGYDPATGEIRLARSTGSEFDDLLAGTWTPLNSVGFIAAGAFR